LFSLDYQNNYVERLSVDDMQYCKTSYIIILIVHGKNGFAEVSKNLVRYKFENNFVELLK